MGRQAADGEQLVKRMENEDTVKPFWEEPDFDSWLMQVYLRCIANMETPTEVDEIDELYTELGGEA